MKKEKAFDDGTQGEGVVIRGSQPRSEDSQPLRWKNGKETDCPPEPPERTSPAVTFILVQ